MSIRDWFASRFGVRAAGTIAAPRPEWLIRQPWLQEAGVLVSPETATQVSAVYGCCRLIVDSLAPAPIRVYEVKKGGVREILYDDPVAYTLEWGAPLDKAPDAPPGQSIEEALLWSALLTGNGYAEIQRDRAGKFFALWPIEPDRVLPRRDGPNGELLYQVTQPGAGAAVGSGGSAVYLRPDQIFHLRGPSFYGWVGDSLVYRAAKAIGIAHASQIYSSSYFANGTVLAGILKHPGKLTPDQKRTFGEQWRENFSGPGKAYGTPLLDQGLDYQSINQDAQKSQLVESRRFQVQEIARFFGVPTTLLADNEAWTNLSELYLGFYRNALLPWAARFDAEATRKLFPQRQPWREVQHDLTKIVMGSFKDQVASLKEAVNGGLKTRNEARTILGDNTIGPDGDVLVVDGNVKRLEDILDPPEPPPPAPTMLPGQSPKDPEDPEEGEGEGKPPPMPPAKKRPPAAAVARVAIALDRFVRRIQARTADLEKNAPERLAENIAEERKRLEPALIAECRAALAESLGLDMRAIEIANAALAGEPAHLAAERLAEMTE